MKPRSLINILLLLSCISFMPGDPPLATKIMAALQSHYKNYPQEKTYVQTDKFVYSSGQTIWFKIYADVYGNPATLSKIVYVQLLGSDGRIIAQNKYPLTQGQAHGDIRLPESLQSDHYQLRCFTAWMLNFDDSAVFHKTLYVRNIFDSLNNRPEPSPFVRKYQVQFFPEGGDLVDNTTDNVAFKATDQYGIPIDVHGTIKDENQAFVTDFSTIHDGMGKFSLHPVADHRYYAIALFPDHSLQRLPLPDAKQFGISMRITERTADAVTIQVVSRQAEAGQFHDVVLAAYQNSGKISITSEQIEHGINNFNISTKGFGTGITRFTIFDKSEVSRAERILFLQDSDPLQLKLQKDTLSFSPKDKSAFTMQIKGADWTVDKANLSISVTDADKIAQDPHSDNICSFLLMTSELKGSIHDPEYYFSNHSDSVKEALDLVMMTNGWRHFGWKKILDGEPVSLSYPVEDSLWIAGRVVGYKPEEAQSHFLKMIIQQGDSSRFIGYVSPDSKGGFILKDYNVPGTSVVYIQDDNKGEKGNKGSFKKYNVKYFMTSLDTVKTAIYVPVQPEEAYGDEKSQFMMWKDDRDAYRYVGNKGLLKAFVVRGRLPGKTDMLVKKYVSPYFEDGKAHDLDMINTFSQYNSSLFDFIKGKFPELMISGEEDHPVFAVNGKITIQNQSIPQHEPTKILGLSVEQLKERMSIDDIPFSEPYVYLDENHSSWDAVKDIPINKIALIRYIPSPASMAPLNGGPIGVLAIYMKKPDEGGMGPSDLTTKYDRYVFHGYSISRQFYSPDYSTKDSTFSKPDTRSTLYWNPDLTADSSNKIHFHFYNSDHARRFRIVAEGMDQQGRLIYFEEVIAEDPKTVARLSDKH